MTGVLPPPLDSRYTYVALLGHGGEALVHHVRDARGADLVVKVYARDPAARRGVWNRLERLRHPALMPLLEWGATADGRAYETMPLLTGGSLADRGRLGFSAVVGLVDRLVGGINQLHEAEIVHRDLKPENLLFREASGDEAVIADFGISGALDGVTATRMMTPGYAPPEAYDGVVLPAWDWWSLGMTVRQIATGARPFAGLPVEAVVRRVREEDVDLVQLPQRLRTLCGGLLERDPARRWGSGRVLEWLDETAAPAPRATTVRAPRPAPTRRAPRPDPSPPKAAPPPPEPAGGLRVAGEAYTTATELAGAARREPERIAQSLFAGSRWNGTDGPGQETRRWILAHGGDQDLLDRLARGTPLARLNVLLSRLDPKGGPVTPLGTLRMAALVQTAVNATRDGSGPDTDRLALVYSRRLLPAFALFPGFESLAGADEKWRTLTALWDAEAARLPAMPAHLRTAGPAAQAALLLAALPSRLTGTGHAALARFPAGPADGGPDWYAAMVGALGGPGSLGGYAVQSVCGGAVAGRPKRAKAAPDAGPARKRPGPAVPPDKGGPAKQAAPFAFDGLVFLTKNELGLHLRRSEDAGPRLVDGDLGPLRAWARRQPDPDGRWPEVEKHLRGTLSAKVRYFYLVMWLCPDAAPAFGGRTALTPDWVRMFLDVLKGTAAPETVANVVWLGSTDGVLDAYASGGPMRSSLGGAQERYDTMLTAWRASTGRRYEDLPISARTQSPQLTAALLLASLRDTGAKQALARLMAERDIPEVLGNLGWFFGLVKDLGGRNTPGGRAVWVANAPEAIAVVEKQLRRRAAKAASTGKRTSAPATPRPESRARQTPAKKQPAKKASAGKQPPAGRTVPPKPSLPPQVPPAGRARLVWEILSQLGRRLGE